MEAEEPEMKARSRALLEKECHNLLSEIERLEQSRAMQNKRLKNVMNLVSLSMDVYSNCSYALRYRYLVLLQFEIVQQ